MTSYPVEKSYQINAGQPKGFRLILLRGSIQLNINKNQIPSTHKLQKVTNKKQTNSTNRSNSLNHTIKTNKSRIRRPRRLPYAAATASGAITTTEALGGTAGAFLPSLAGWAAFLPSLAGWAGAAGGGGFMWGGGECLSFKSI